MMSYDLPKPFEVWRLAFFFDDKPDVKKMRPVVILSVDNKSNRVLVAGAKVTSHALRKDFPSEVSLIDWKLAGLKKPSAVRCSKIASFNLNDFKGNEKYGTLSARDRRAVIYAYQNMQASAK